MSTTRISGRALSVRVSASNLFIELGSIGNRVDEIRGRSYMDVCPILALAFMILRGNRCQNKSNSKNDRFAFGFSCQPSVMMALQFIYS